MDWDRLLTVARDPQAEARRRCEREGTPLAVSLSSYVPLEILDAFGLCAMRWFGTLEDFPVADGVMQTYACTFVRSALEWILRGEPPVGLVATASGCDVVTAVPGMLSVARPDLATTHLRLPIQVEGPGVEDQAFRALVAFCEEVRERLDRRMDPSLLDQTTRARQEVRKRLQACFDALPTGSYSSVSVYGAALAAQVMAPEQWLQSVPAPETLPAGQGVPILLSGESVPSLEVIEDLERVGLRVVADDTNTGTRECGRRVDLASPDLVRSIAKSLMDRPGHSPERFVQGRPAAVARRAREAGARVAILFHQKFCDPCAFEAPGLMAALRQAGIPSMVLELDRQKRLTAGQRTRVQTLVESLT